jgi:replication fork clamp-binding protein CrfC
MDGENQTINDGGASSVPHEIGGLVSTVEFKTPSPTADADPEGANNTKGDQTPDPNAKDGQAAADAKPEDQIDGKSDDKDDQLDRFDKHPRFQELRAKAEAAEKRAKNLEAQFAELTKSTPAKKDPGSSGELPFKDTAKMSQEELLDWQAENPHEYYQNVLAQAKHEMNQDVENRLSEKAIEDAIVTEYQAFAEKHPDFDPMWDSGKIEAFVKEHPGHNAISAYMLMTEESRLQAVVDKAVAEAEKKFTSNQRAKRENKSLGAGPQTTGTHDAPVDAELQDTKKFGGPTTVMANRLKQMRLQQGKA